jgi:hypothetical protein
VLLMVRALVGEGARKVAQHAHKAVVANHVGVRGDARERLQLLRDARGVRASGAVRAPRRGVRALGHGSHGPENLLVD